jgi:hypothetical protein
VKEGFVLPICDYNIFQHPAALITDLIYRDSFEHVQKN